MTKEEELRDIIESYCSAHEVEEVDNTLLKLLEWFEHWKERKDA